MMDTGGGTPIRDQSFFSFYQDIFKLEFLSGLEFFFLKSCKVFAHWHQ